MKTIYTVSLVILATVVFGKKLAINYEFVILGLLNSAVFAGVGYFVAVLADNHFNMNNFSSFIITPMVFLCRTIFSLDSVPGAVKRVISVLHCAKVSCGLRWIVCGRGVALVTYSALIGYGLILRVEGILISKKGMF